MRRMLIRKLPISTPSTPSSTFSRRVSFTSRAPEYFSSPSYDRLSTEFSPPRWIFDWISRNSRDISTLCSRFLRRGRPFPSRHSRNNESNYNCSLISLSTDVIPSTHALLSFFSFSFSCFSRLVPLSCFCRVTSSFFVVSVIFHSFHLRVLHLTFLKDPTAAWICTEWTT